MPLFESADYLRFYNQGEEEVSVDREFLVDRFSPAIVSGTPEYTLPDTYLSIKRVTYLGQKLDPLTRRNENEVFQSATQTGTPFWYVFNNIGANKIRLFPTPGDSLNAGVNLWSTDIPTSCIIEAYRVSDNATFVIPSWMKRRLLKQYVGLRLSMIDGAGYDKKAIKYFQAKWDIGKMTFVNLLDELHYLPRKLMVQDISSSNYFPGEPVLPIADFGISVDEGE